MDEATETLVEFVSDFNSEIEEHSEALTEMAEQGTTEEREYATKSFEVNEILQTIQVGEELTAEQCDALGEGVAIWEEEAVKYTPGLFYKIGLGRKKVERYKKMEENICGID